MMLMSRKKLIFLSLIKLLPFCFFPDIISVSHQIKFVWILCKINDEEVLIGGLKRIIEAAENYQKKTFFLMFDELLVCVGKLFVDFQSGFEKFFPFPFKVTRM